MTVIKSETRETYTTAGTLYPAAAVILLEFESGTIDLAAAIQRVRELIGAAEVASANEAWRSWVDDEPTELFGDDDDDRCPFCRARDGQCSH